MCKCGYTVLYCVCVLFSVYCAKVTMSHNIMSYCWQCVCIRVCVCVCVF